MKKLLLLLIACATWACSSPPPPATPMTFANYNSKANHQKQISLECYLRLPTAALISDTMLLDLIETPDSKSKPLPVSLRVGSSANQVEKPPKDYSDKDLKVHANDGTLIQANQKVRVSGKLIYSSTSSILFAPVDIQKL